MKYLSKEPVVGKNYRFTILTPYLLRMEYSEKGEFVDECSQIVQNREFPEIEYELVMKEDCLEIITTGFHLYYDLNPFSSMGLIINMKSNFTDYGNRWHYGDSIETLKGTARTLDNVDGSTELGEGIISKQGYAVLDDSASALINEKGEVILRENEGIDLYFFGYQHFYKEALQDYYRLTGPMPLLPRYALGNWWSRFWQYTEESYLSLMDQFAEENIPLAVSVIDMDWHLRDIPAKYGSGWTGYTWNKDLFPEPERFLKELHIRGLKVTLNVHPADGIRAFESCYATVAEHLKLNVSLEEPAVFDLTDKAFLRSYFEDVHRPLEEQGIDFWWIDWQQGSQSKEAGLDPLWLLNYYHYLDNQEKTGEGLILSRYAGPGSHRYPVGFSGDSIISWKSLKFQPYFTAVASNIGYGWWSHDIGGHMNGYRDDELILRWVQLGTYSPINRLHSSSSPFNSKEPWNFPKEIADSMKESLRERHRLLPYLYSMNVRAHEKLLPLILPIYYLEAEAKEAYEVPNEFLFGTELLVLPITSSTDVTYKHAQETVYLPKGEWYDYTTGWRYEGDTMLTVHRRLDQQAVFAKAGAIIPTDYAQVLNHGEALPTDILWKIFPGADNSFELVEDDGKKRCVTTLHLNWEERKIWLEVTGDRSILPQARYHHIHLYGVLCNQEVLKENCYQYILKEGEELVFKGTDKIEKQMLTEELFKRIDLPNISYDVKNELWAGLSTLTSVKKKINFVKTFGDAYLSELLYELFYIEES